jgi:ribonuclease VapC
MIAVDTSALIAVVGNEPMARHCSAVLEVPTEEFILSAGTLLEVQIVAARKGCRSGLDELLALLPFSIIEVTAARAELAASAYRQFGKTFHPAALNFGDCFAYATAREFDCPLLFIGDDFALTDIRAALDRSMW